MIATYDFGVNEALSNQVSVARTGDGRDRAVRGPYNALVNNFGVQFAIVPNLAGLAASAARGRDGRPVMNPAQAAAVTGAGETRMTATWQPRPAARRPRGGGGTSSPRRSAASGSGPTASRASSSTSSSPPAVLAAAALECDRVEWCLVVGCIGLVLTAELFNTAIEMLFRGLARRPGTGCTALDIAAGAVLVASLTAATIGGSSSAGGCWRRSG